MPYQTTTTDLWAKMSHRVGIIGAPNKGKTQSLLTFPPPIALISMPNEMGINTIPIKEVDGKPHLYDFAQKKILGDAYLFDPADTEIVSWSAMASEVESTVTSVIAGKQYQTVALDGIHKYYDVLLNAKSGGAAAKGEDFEGRRAYPQAASVLFNNLRKWIQSNVPYLVVTMWMAPDRDNPGADEKNPRSHFFAALAGQAGQKIVGEFAVFVEALTEGTPPAPVRYVWKTKPDEKTWGVGIKMPPAVAAKMPMYVPQDWVKLAPLLVMP